MADITGKNLQFQLVCVCYSHSLPVVAVPDGQRVGLGVEDPAVQGDDAVVVREEEEEVLERLPQEETLHLVPRVWVCRIRYIID